MDSLTQAALGAAVSVAVLRRRAPAWQSALWGAAMGTIPDLDVLIDHGNPVLNMTEHRAHSHALFYQVALAVGLGGAAYLAFARSAPPEVRSKKTSAIVLWSLAMMLAWTTHALLDAMTVYGTRLWLPFSDAPVGLGSVFIIDPLYTVPLLIGLVGAWRWAGPVGTTLLWLGLGLSSLYLVWSLVVQQWVLGQVKPYLPSAHAKLLVTPSPFNTVLWRVLAVDNAGYHEGWISLLDKQVNPRWVKYACPASAYDQAQSVREVAELAYLSDGFFCLKEEGGAWRMTDLRMGQEPGYVFAFAIPRAPADDLTHASIVQLPFVSPPLPLSFTWLYQRLMSQTPLSLPQWQAQRAADNRPH
jgi:inner membrane protein